MLRATSNALSWSKRYWTISPGRSRSSLAAKPRVSFVEKQARYQETFLLPSCFRHWAPPAIGFRISWGRPMRIDIERMISTCGLLWPYRAVSRFAIDPPMNRICYCMSVVKVQLRRFDKRDGLYHILLKSFGCVFRYTRRHIALNCFTAIGILSSKIDECFEITLVASDVVTCLVLLHLNRAHCIS